MKGDATKIFRQILTVVSVPGHEDSREQAEPERFTSWAAPQSDKTWCARELIGHNESQLGKRVKLLISTPIHSNHEPN